MTAHVVLEKNIKNVAVNNMYPSSSEGLNKETTNEIFFFTPAFDAFNNFSAHQIEIWGVLFPTCEHAYQWRKFNELEPQIAQNILEAKNPHKAKQIARNYNDKRIQNWNDVKVSIMKEVLQAKLEQHEDIQERLKASGNRTIIENSPVDSFWGNGPDNAGQNILGKLWMELRNE